MMEHWISYNMQIVSKLVTRLLGEKNQSPTLQNILNKHLMEKIVK